MPEAPRVSALKNRALRPINADNLPFGKQKVGSFAHPTLQLFPAYLIARFGYRKLFTLQLFSARSPCSGIENASDFNIYSCLSAQLCNSFPFTRATLQFVPAHLRNFTIYSCPSAKLYNLLLLVCATLQFIPVRSHSRSSASKNRFRRLKNNRRKQ